MLYISSKWMNEECVLAKNEWLLCVSSNEWINVRCDVAQN